MRALAKIGMAALSLNRVNHMVIFVIIAVAATFEARDDQYCKETAILPSNHLCVSFFASLQVLHTTTVTYDRFLPFAFSLQEI